MEHSEISSSKDLPVWDLSSLYPGMRSSELKQDLEKVAQKATSFEIKYKDNVSQLTGPQLAHSIIEYEKIEETLGRLMSFAQLIYAGDMLDSEISNFHQSIHEKVTEISSHLLFFNLELNSVSGAELKDKLKWFTKRQMICLKKILLNDMVKTVIVLDMQQQLIWSKRKPIVAICTLTIRPLHL